MNKHTQLLYQFLSVVKGSWRNAFYIECSGCPHGKSDCGSHFLTVDSNGKPVIFSVRWFEEATGESVDKTECAAVISREAFESLYDRWMIWNISNPKKCSILLFLSDADSHTP